MSSPDLMKIAEGREAQIFAWEPGKVLRLLYDSGAAQHNEIQAMALAFVKQAGGPAPSVYGTTTVEGRPGMIMERVDGPSLLAGLASRPWTVGRVGSRLGRLHAEINTIVVPEIVTSAKTILSQRFGSPLVPEDLALAAAELLESLPEGDRLCHGDFHPDNVLLDGERHVVIDWSNLSRGDPHFDVARSLILLRWGQPPQPLPLFLRVVASLGRRYLLHSYLRAYRRRIPLRREVLSRWELVSAIARLAEGIEGEAELITAWARERLRDM